MGDGDCVRWVRESTRSGKILSGTCLFYLKEPRPWANKIVAIAHNAKEFDFHFILNRAILRKWKRELIMNGLKIMCLKMEHVVFLDNVSFLPCPLRNVPDAFGPSKLWYPLYFNTEENLNYIGPIPEVSYHSVNEMGEKERSEFLVWYDSRKSGPFYNRRVLGTYCQDDVTVLRQACRVFRREFIHIGNIEVFLESITIGSACNKFLRSDS